MNLKRKPKSKHGRLLFVLRHRYLLDERFNAINDLPKDEELTKRIALLTKRIQGLLAKEDRQSAQQMDMFKTIAVSFTHPKFKTVRELEVGATSKREANAIVRKKYGKGVKILRA